MSWDRENSGFGLNFSGDSVSEDADRDRTAYSRETFGEGVHEWKLKIGLSTDDGGETSVGVALSTEHAETSMESEPHGQSWSFDSCGVTFFRGVISDYSKGFEEGDVITVVLDLCNRTVSFKQNDKDLGVAFQDLPQGQYRLAVSLFLSSVTCICFASKVPAYSPPIFDEGNCDPIMLRFVNTADGSEKFFPTFKQILVQRGNLFENLLGGDHEAKEIKLKLRNFAAIDALVFFLQTGTILSPFGSPAITPLSPKALISLVHVADYIGSKVLLNFAKYQFSDLELAKEVAADPDFGPDLIKDHNMKLLFPSRFYKDSPWNPIMQSWLSRDKRKSFAVEVMEKILFSK